jgi:clan AA aspartic protease
VIGLVDDSGRALIELRVRASDTASVSTQQAWIDTAFDGELVMPREQIEQLGLRQSAAVRATLADGSDVLLESFDCYLDWFGQWRPIQVIANQGWIPLLGVGLLQDRRLVIDFRSRELSLE